MRTLPAPGASDAGNFPTPPATYARPAAGSVPQELASAHRQLDILQGQLTAESSSNPRVRKLIGRLRSLTASALSMTTPHPKMSRPTLSSLMGRIARLNRLLATLTRLSPASSRSLAPALRTLRSLLRSLLVHVVAAPVGMPGRAGPRRAAGETESLPVRSAVAALGAVPSTGAARAIAPSIGPAAVPPVSPAGGSPAAGTPRPEASRPAPPRRAAPAAAPSRPVQTSTGGFAASAGGAPASGAPGGMAAPVAALVLSLLCALLSRRLGLEGLAWRSALLQLRLERPG